MTSVRRCAWLFAVALAGTGGCGPTAAPGVDDTGPLAVVRGQTEAFNRHDTEDLLSWIAPDVEWYDVSADGATLQLMGHEELRASMNSYFEAIPTVRSAIEEAVVTGDLVAIRERATWADPEGQRSQASLGVYEVRNGLIRRVWYYPATP